MTSNPTNTTTVLEKATKLSFTKFSSQYQQVEKVNINFDEEIKKNSLCTFS
jgi:hypothetical protein